MENFTTAQIFSRSRLLLGEEAMDRLAQASVCLCGLGGVGSYAAEALARSGIGALTLIDFDQVTVSNMNRQLCALTNTIGQNKTETMAARIELINPCCRLTIRTESITSAHIASIMEGYDYVVDAIDDVAAKTAIICYAHQNNIAVISAMGAAKRVRPELLRLADIADTHCCPLARIMRKELKKLGIVTGVNVVYSTEKPLSTPSDADTEIGVKQSLGSVVFVPGAMGLIIAGKVIRDVAGIEEADGFIRTSGYR